MGNSRPTSREREHVGISPVALQLRGNARPVEGAELHYHEYQKEVTGLDGHGKVQEGDRGEDEALYGDERLAVVFPHGGSVPPADPIASFKRGWPSHQQAGCHASRGPQPPRMDPRIPDRHTQHLLRHGYAIVPNFLMPEEVAGARANMLRYFPTAEEL